MSLKTKLIHGISWVLVEQLGNKGSQFIIGIIIARLLVPEDFGLIGMITIFISVSEGISSGGFVQALIRKSNTSAEDFNTAFVYNFFVSLFLYIVLFFAAPHIGNFYNENQLSGLLKILMLIVIIDSFSFVQRAKLIKVQNFKALALSSIIAQIASGCIGITLAYLGYGVWSLVVKMIIYRFISAIILISINFWVPKLRLSHSAFNDLFGFGFRILISQIIERVYRNIYLVLIGKFFNSSELGYYTRANMFKLLISEQLTSSIQKTSLPMMADIAQNEIRMKNFIRKLIKLTLFVSAFFLIGMVPLSNSLILFLLGEKWFESIFYLKLLSISAILYPVGEINLNMLQIKGRADLILKIQTIKKVIALPIILIGVILGIKQLLVGVIIISVSDFIANSYYSKKYIGFSSLSQLRSPLESIAVMALSAIIVFGIGKIICNWHQGIILLVQGFAYSLICIVYFELRKNNVYFELKETILTILKIK